MINFRRLALVSGMAVLSAVAFTPKAQAQSTTVDFTGSIPATCTINSTTAGTLALNNLRELKATVSPLVGTPGNINVTCNGGTTFTITSIANNGSSLPSSSYAAAIDNTTANIIDGTTLVLRGDVSPNNNAATDAGAKPINVASPVQPGPITNKDYKVELYIANYATNPVLPPGSYNVQVGITLTPQ